MAGFGLFVRLIDRDFCSDRQNLHLPDLFMVVSENNVCKLSAVLVTSRSSYKQVKIQHSSFLCGICMQSHHLAAKLSYGQLCYPFLCHIICDFSFSFSPQLFVQPS